MKKIIIFNFGILFFLCILIFILLNILNFFLSSAPRYKELLFDFEKGNFREKREKLIFYKSNKVEYKDVSLKINSDNYKLFNFSGNIVNRNCGTLESGKTELFYFSDGNGFRENDDKLYYISDVVLLGDSFTESICVNKPFDLKSNLQNFNKKITILNLGKQGSDYPNQLQYLLQFTKETKFNTLIWFFYEGNDYENKLKNFDLYNFKNNFKSNNINNEKLLKNINYNIEKNFEISSFYKFKVYLAELVNGLSFLLKYFNEYENLLDYEDYNSALEIAESYLDRKNISNRYIYYIPSWQRLTNYKSNFFFFYKYNPHVKQLDKLKNDIKNISEKNSFKFIDGEELFLKLDNPLEVFHYDLNTHFNDFGYAYLANDIYNNIDLNNNEQN